LNVPRNEKQLNTFLQKDIDMAYECLIGTKEVWEGKITFDQHITHIRELRKIN